MVKHLLGMLLLQLDYLHELLQLHLDLKQQIIQLQLELHLISPTTRHLIHFGTETTIGSASTQDDMFIRFSVDEVLMNIHLKRLTLLVHKEYKMVQKLWVH